MNGRDSPPWYCFDGFTFFAKAQAANIDQLVLEALSATCHIGYFSRGLSDEEDYDPKLLALLNLCVLFDTVNYFKPYMAHIDFWRTVSEKWGLLPDYRMTRLLIHMYSGARETFLADFSGNAAPEASKNIVSGLSVELGKIVDEWRAMYKKDYVLLRMKAYEDPDDDLAQKFELAKRQWKGTLSVSTCLLLMHALEAHEGADYSNGKQLVSHKSDTNHSDEIDEDSPASDKESESDLEQEQTDVNMDIDNYSNNNLSPVLRAFNSMPTSSVEIEKSQRHHKSAGYDTLLVTPTVSPLTSPSREESPASITADDDYDTLEDSETNFSAIMQDSNKLPGTLSSSSCPNTLCGEAITRSPKKVHFELPTRPAPPGTKTLFPSSKDAGEGSNTAGGAGHVSKWFSFYPSPSRGSQAQSNAGSRGHC
ncbi:hypothetical protein BKA67DRAFT_672008 [Truncatella angustata]|uniref:Uncharacterized protein n=1 Tax=Truncatella angustata TaxID=152316 RepID=A0A9P9A0R6_9PEZI|nr:uncharacterized protein BKA67DRAFT_672008 [Truncatella angustata]KAH6656255.1 hypothetical protein BKA67DRAFT_672008 [Truncatella angustata]